MRRRSVIVLTAVLLFVPAGSAFGAGDPPTDDGAWQAIHAALDTSAPLLGPTGEANADVARAALGLADAVEAGGPSAVWSHLPTLADAHLAAGEALTGAPMPGADLFRARIAAVAEAETYLTTGVRPDVPTLLPDGMPTPLDAITEVERLSAGIHAGTTPAEAFELVYGNEAGANMELAQERLTFLDSFVPAFGPDADQVELLSRFLTEAPTPYPVGPEPVIERSPDLVTALERVLEAYGRSIGEHEREQLAIAASLPPEAAEPLTTILDMHLVQLAAARTIPADGMPDLGLLHAAQATIIPEVTRAAGVLPCVPATTIDLRPQVLLDLDCGSDLHWYFVNVLVDNGGNDRYTNNAGAARNTVGSQNAAMLVDASGDDRYGSLQARTSIGSGESGLGLLVDIEGNDDYEGRGKATIGSGVLGAGALIDLQGDDIYDAGLTEHQASIGSGLAGLGLLWDADGADDYTGYGRATIGSGEAGGSGTLMDGLAGLSVGGEDVTATVNSLTGGAAIGSAGDAALADLPAEPAGARSAGLLINVLGNDDYTVTGPAGPATAAIGSAIGGVGTLYDTGGVDEYIATGAQAANGAAWADPSNVLSAIPPPSAPVGVLVDGTDTDRYYVTGDVGNGAGYHGMGFLFDGTGFDDYYFRGGDAGNGAGFEGAGALIDLTGNDLYSAKAPELRAANGASAGFNIAVEQWTSLPSVLIDAGGRDVYVGEVTATATDFRSAVNGASFRGGGAYLLDLGLDPDRYTGRTASWYGMAANGVAELAKGAAVLWDAGGNDDYLAHSTATRPLVYGNGGGVLGAGLLVDLAGNDDYELRGEGGGNGFGILGVGMLHDAGGSDVYEAATHSPLHYATTANGGGFMGVGVLVDPQGNDVFHAKSISNGAAYGPVLGAPVPLPVSAAPAPVPGAGILVSGVGSGTYLSGGGVSSGSGNGYGLGLLVDPGGALSTYIGGSHGVFQGAGSQGGVGVLIDAADRATFDIGDSASGQGSAAQGVGILLAVNAAGAASFSADVTADLSPATGAGLGIRASLGLTTGVEPDLSCREGAPITQVNQPAAGIGPINLCAPSDASKVQIIDPVTGDPLTVNPVNGDPGTIYKPPVPCTGLCDVVTGLLGPEADDWIEEDHITSTTSGGATLLYKRTSGQPSGQTRGSVELVSVDDFCRLSCAST